MAASTNIDPFIQHLYRMRHEGWLPSTNQIPATLIAMLSRALPSWDVLTSASGHSRRFSLTPTPPVYKRTGNLRAVHCFLVIQKSKAPSDTSASRLTTRSPLQNRWKSELWGGASRLCPRPLTSYIGSIQARPDAVCQDLTLGTKSVTRCRCSNQTGALAARSIAPPRSRRCSRLFPPSPAP